MEYVLICKENRRIRKHILAQRRNTAEICSVVSQNCTDCNSSLNFVAKDVQTRKRKRNSKEIVPECNILELDGHVSPVLSEYR